MNIIILKMSIISESEKKRLRSLKEKKQAFRTKGQIIQQALNNLDNTTRNKKIIFDDDNIDVQQSLKLKEKRDLFDSDDDHDNNNEKNNLWNEDEFNVKKNKKVTLGNDARFTLDDRFIEDDHKTEKTKLVDNIDESNLQKEKERQLDILESILGAPLSTKHPKTKQETKSAKKGLMVRYNPSENGHCEYEVKPAAEEMKEKNKKKKRGKSVSEIEKSVSIEVSKDNYHAEEEIKEKNKKRKRDKSVPEIEEPAPVEVSKDIYYAVSDTLTESLKKKEEFSLLRAHGREKNDTHTEDGKDSDAPILENNNVQKFRFNFSANNAFKYNSSDNEDVDNAPIASEKVVDEVKNDAQANNLFGHKNTLFFDNNDVRFNEAMRFFNTEATSNDEFKNLRRELKMIVRTKVRKNEKRNQPWNKKRKIKRLQY